MQRERLALLALVALGLSPGLLWRSAPPPKNDTQTVSVTRLDGAQGEIGPLSLTDMWHLDSANTRFGGYSALLLRADGGLLAGSDAGNMLLLPRPGTPGPPAQIGPFGSGKETDKRLSDLESLTSDPATGRIWAGYEGKNAIRRLNADLSGEDAVRPLDMRQWGGNSGPEAMVRLADGRFIVLAEGSVSWRDRTHYALLYPGDPLDAESAVRFRFDAPDGYDPVDMKQIPDGRVLVLLRRVAWGLPPSFDSALLLLDPAEIAEGEVWRGRMVAELAAPLLPENYEGLAVEELSGGKLALWIIADDNISQLQRSLLARLEWTPPALARADTATAPDDTD